MSEPFSASFVAPADLATIERVHSMFERLGDERPDLPEQTRSAFELAVVEVVTNVVQHSPDRPPVTVELRIVATPRGLEAVVTDDAPPAAVDLDAAALPEDDLAESGRGLALVGLLVDRFEHEPLASGNRWTLAVEAG
ncbi:ATP-binding protein [Leifsonia sp. F6_8S_P_1B]|uniref:ATP-binding protein n=1 Tax=Leifsonia williamsii TaxID=3035919 RepID=A0ABT8KAD7_9MICO|nr:ATP-binding protein [Leifsonia williamsii]MDN4613771.1 ATP-binding protein [Leifsonia williamsii]